jgi:hypothetical protein
VAIKIPFIADVSKFLSGTRDLEESLDDVADSLDDISTAGAQVEARVGDNLDDTAKAADASAEKISKSFKTAFHEVEAAGRTSSRKVRDEVDDVGHKGSATLHEFSAEAKQNVAESLSSFTGSAESAVDAVQSTFGGLVSALGPAGLVGAAAIAAGIGLARGLFAKSQEAAEQFRERVLNIFDELRESGDITPEFKMDTLAGIISDAKALQAAFDVDNVDAFNDLLHQTGLNVGQLQTYFSGLTGDAGELGDAQLLLTQQLTYLRGILTDPSASLAQQGQVRVQVDAISTLRDALADQGNAYGDARAQADLLNELMPKAADATDDATDATDDNTEALASNNEQLRIAAGLRGDAVASELDMKDALDAVSKARKDNGLSLSKNTDAGRDNLRSIQQAMKGIQEYGDALVDNGASSDVATRKMRTQEDVLVNRVQKAFHVTRGEAEHYIDTLGGIPPAKDTKVTVDDHGTAKTTKDKVDEAAKDRQTTVSVAPDMSGFNETVNDYLSGRSFKVNLEPRISQPKLGKPIPQ